MNTNSLRKMHQYLVGEQIARSTFSSIWKGYHKESLELVAIKLISKGKMHGFKGGANILFNECYLAPLLIHPHIVPIHETIETNGQIFQVMDLEKNDLLHYMIKNKIPIEEKYRITDEILSAIEYLHQHQIAHLDIKLENILLDDDLEVKVCDFGFASININQIHQSFGSENYAAPEVYSKKCYDGIMADLWSVGVLLYAIFADQMPFKHEPHNPAEIDYSLVPNDVAEIIRRLLVLNPLERMSLSQIRQSPAFSAIQCRIINTPIDLVEPIDDANAMTTKRISDILRMKLKEVYTDLKIPEPTITKVYYYLVQASLEYEGISLLQMNLNGPYSCPQSCPVIELPGLIKSLNPINISTKSDQSSVSRFIRELLIRRRFCLSISPNGLRTAILNKPDTDIKIEINYDNRGSDCNITISSIDEEDPEVQNIISTLRETFTPV